MFYSICPNCFEETPSELCPYCGYDQYNSKQYNGVLPPQSILNARYLVGRVLGKGGFGVTYLAKDLAMNSRIAIKECLPDAYSYRADDLCIYQNPDETLAFNKCKENFRKEISSLLELRENPFVVNAFDFFSENNTEYFAMEYIDGVSVKLLTHRQDGKISFDNAVLILFTVGSALMEVHRRGIIHRDISPENIMVTEDGRIKLIDFGAAKSVYAPDDEESIFLKPGFAPPEQYEVDGNQGPWTDVYALGATFYTIISGAPLVDATYRVDADTMKSLIELGCDVPEFVSESIRKAMSLDIADRYGDVGEFLNDMAPLISNAVEIDKETLGLVKHEREKQKLNIEDNETKYPYVEVLTGNAAGTRVKIPDYGFVSVGRSAQTSDIVIDDTTQISRTHCLVGYNRSRNHFVIIGKSGNGTFYSNGYRMLENTDSFINPDDEFFLVEQAYRLRVRLI